MKLKGKNRIKLLQNAAERLVSKLAEHRNVTGIILLGGLTRGFADEFSDLDITVFIKERNKDSIKQIRAVTANEEKHSHIETDLEIHVLKEFRRQQISEIHRWDLSKAQIAHDPTGETKKTIAAKLKVPKEFWTMRIVRSAEYMKWYCCPPAENASTIAETWINRGDLLSAHYCVNYAVELLLETVFAVNKEFLPPQKWRMFYFKNLKWLPMSNNQIKEAMVIKELSVRDLDRRLGVLRQVWHEVMAKIEQETKFTSNKIDKYYVERILGQNST